MIIRGRAVRSFVTVTGELSSRTLLAEQRLKPGNQIPSVALHLFSAGSMAQGWQWGWELDEDFAYDAEKKSWGRETGVGGRGRRKNPNSPFPRITEMLLLKGPGWQEGPFGGWGGFWWLARCCRGGTRTARTQMGAPALLHHPDKPLAQEALFGNEMLLGARISPSCPHRALLPVPIQRRDTWGRRGLVSRPCPLSPYGEVFTRARPLRVSLSGAGIGTGVRGGIHLGSEALLCCYLRNGSWWRGPVAAALLVETGQGESELDPRQGLGSGSRLNQDEVGSAAARHLGSTRCSCRPLLGSGSAPS